MTPITRTQLKEWAAAALIRAIKTVAQTAVAMIPVGATVQEVGWLTVASTALLAGILSILTSIGGLPEAADGKTVPVILNEAQNNA